MDGATIQAKVYAGIAKAALRVGLPFDVFRPTGASSPLAAPNRLYSTLAALDSCPGWRFSRPNEYGDAAWYPLIDATRVQVGDYIVSAERTLFIAAKQALLPLMAVDCNRVVSAYRPQVQSGVGALGYGGNTSGVQTLLISGWPASVLQGTKGERSDANLPGDTRAPWWLVLLPPIAGVTLRHGDIIECDLGRRYTISSAELNDLGWRIAAAQTQT